MSGKEVAAVRMQSNRDGESFIVSTASRALNPTEQRYSVAEQELVVIIFAPTELSTPGFMTDTMKPRGFASPFNRLSFKLAGLRLKISARKLYSCSCSIHLDIRLEVSADLLMNDKVLLSVFRFISCPYT